MIRPPLYHRARTSLSDIELERQVARLHNAQERRIETEPEFASILSGVRAELEAACKERQVSPSHAFANGVRTGPVRCPTLY